MHARILVALSLIALNLIGCAVNTERSRPVRIEVGSAVDLRTQLGAAELIWSSMQRLGCRQTDVIYPELLERSPDFEAGKGFVAKGQVKERWVAHGCATEVPYIVYLKANRQHAGGTDVYIQRERGGS